MKTQDSDRLGEIEVTQAALRVNIEQSRKMIEKSRQVLEKQRRAGASATAPLNEPPLPR